MKLPDATPGPSGRAPSSPPDTFNRITRNILDLGAALIFTMAASAVVALLLPRFLGDVNLGKLAFAGAFTGYFGLIVGLGTGTYLTKEVARDPPSISKYAFNAVIMRLPLCFVAAFLGIVTINLLGFDGLTRTTVYFLFIGMTLGAIYGVLVGSVQGLQEMRPMAVSQVLMRVINSAAVTTLLLTGHGLLEVALANSLITGVGILVVGYALVRHDGFRFSLDLAMWRPLLFGGFPYFASRVSRLIYARVDILMLSGFAGDAVIGWYAAAWRIIAIPALVPGIVMMAVFPALSSAAGSGNMQSFNSIARRGLQVVLVGTIPMAVGLMLLSDKLIDVFHYPSQFQHSVPIMIILALNAPLVGVDMVIGSALNALDKQRQWALTGVTAAFLNPAMNMVLIPITQSAYGNGAIGAATATVLTEVFMMSMGLWLLPRGVLDRSSLSVALRCLAAAAVMAAVVWLVRDFPIVVPIALGALVYGGCCLLFRAVVISDLQRFWAYFQQRQGGRASLPYGG